MNQKQKTNVTKVPSSLLRDAANNLGLVEDSGILTLGAYLKLSEMEAKDIFKAYCEWHGLFGAWPDMLWKNVIALKEAEIK